jgi:adenylate cyclase
MLIDCDNLDMRYNCACLYATYLGEPERALSFLDRYLSAIGNFQISLVEADPDLDPLRDEPRFKAMLSRAKKRLGIAEALPAG